MALLAVTLCGLGMAVAAASQTGDAIPDGDTHPYVGALLRARADHSLTITCSGTLVAPRVFLTAGHCSDYLLSLGQDEAYVTFDPNFGDPSNVYSTPWHGRVIENPTWHKPYTNDTAIVLFDRPVTGIAPQKVAPLGLLDSLGTKTLNASSFLNVGYGTSEQVVVPTEGPTFPFDGIRKYTYSGYHALNQNKIHLDQSLARGLAGTGYGDSGGPTFLTVGGTQYVIAVVSTGDVPCKSTSVNERVDTANAHAFLDPYLALP
jgi:secreted trypsin-like serine protease